MPYICNGSDSHRPKMKYRTPSNSAIIFILRDQIRNNAFHFVVFAMNDREEKLLLFVCSSDAVGYHF